jgi:hypothetical protein
MPIQHADEALTTGNRLPDRLLLTDFGRDQLGTSISFHRSPWSMRLL